MFEFLQFSVHSRSSLQIFQKEERPCVQIGRQFHAKDNRMQLFGKSSREMQNFPVKNYTSLFDTKVGDQKSFEFVVWHEFKSQFNRYVQ